MNFLRGLQCRSWWWFRWAWICPVSLYVSVARLSGMPTDRSIHIRSVIWPTVRWTNSRNSTQSVSPDTKGRICLDGHTKVVVLASSRLSDGTSGVNSWGAFVRCLRKMLQAEKWRRYWSCTWDKIRSNLPWGGARRYADVRGQVGTDGSTIGAKLMSAENTCLRAAGTNPLTRELFITTICIRFEENSTETRRLMACCIFEGSEHICIESDSVWTHSSVSASEPRRDGSADRIWRIGRAANMNAVPRTNQQYVPFFGYRICRYGDSIRRDVYVRHLLESMLFGEPPWRMIGTAK